MLFAIAIFSFVFWLTVCAALFQFAKVITDRSWENRIWRVIMLGLLFFWLFGEPFRVSVASFPVSNMIAHAVAVVIKLSVFWGFSEMYLTRSTPCSPVQLVVELREKGQSKQGRKQSPRLRLIYSAEWQSEEGPKGY